MGSKLGSKMRPLKGYFKQITTVMERSVQMEPKVKPFESIPGPKPLPLIGNLWRYFPVIGHYSMSRLHRTYEQMYHEFGPIVKEKVFGDRVIVHLYDIRDMSTVYASQGKLPERRSHRALAEYRKERPHIYGSPGLLPSNGEEWYRFRQLFQHILISGATTQACAGAIEDITEDLIAKIPSQLDRNLEMDIQPLLFKWALECIGVLTLNRRLGCLSDIGNEEAMGLVEAANNIHRAVFHTENSPLYYKRNYKILAEAQEYVEGVVEKYIAEAYKEIHDEKNKHSVLARLVAAGNVSRKDLFTMILDMFLAGIDTTANALSFVLYNLSKNQRVQEKLRKVLIEHLPHKDSRYSEPRIRCRYLNLVLHESFRVNPTAIGTGRILTKDLVLGGYHVPAKTMVILQHQVASKFDENFPDAHVFRPERWDEGGACSVASTPFGYGARMCIGVLIARKELTIAVARIMRNFELSYHHEDIDCINMLINVPDKPVLLRFESVPN